MPGVSMAISSPMCRSPMVQDNTKPREEDQLDSPSLMLNMQPEESFNIQSGRSERVIIVGAGPSGMATAACLRMKGIPYIIIERAGCIASLWKERTYDRLKMHLSKESCRLPFKPFPDSYPTFVSRQQFIDYLEEYASEFGIQPRFNETVQSASFDEASQTWCVQTIVVGPFAEGPRRKLTHMARWLVIATGENAEMIVPELPGLNEFRGGYIHSSQYRNGDFYGGKKVLVVGCGNSGMEIALDLANCGADASIVVRSPVHILTREIFGMSTFSVAMRLMKSLPMWLVDYMLVSYSRLALGDTAVCGIERPKVGPLELKCKMGKTPVLNVGTFERIQAGDIKVRPAVERLTETGARFVDGTLEDYDAVIFATGYKSTVLRWLKDKENFFGVDSLPRDRACGQSWKGRRGLYVAGMCNKGILGGSTDAERIANDVHCIMTAKTASIATFATPPCGLTPPYSSSTSLTA
ncbi:hypothetical protein KP509_05G083300 [Ceratopteris richardii]|uniref:Flavin-containing monooxygenase n=1 Tax=Ceratopteris richardii TaxID=49495 RepID=A0A8T2UW30_CERRI|nr:hypothetical protein KP509_05G083300 [Ceratopteris richardii]